jgi:hypothetical protein
MANLYLLNLDVYAHLIKLRIPLLYVNTNALNMF